MTRAPALRLVAAASAAAVVGVVLWLLLAPPSLGGSTGYAIVSGSSMHPQLVAGDLAILRERSAYEVGSVVAYRSDQLGQLVLHRIVARDGDRYVFKGDANSSRDVEQPRADALVGELWVTVPRVGAALAWIRTPLHLAALVGGTALLLLIAAVGARAARRRRGAVWHPAGVRAATAAIGAVLGLSLLLGAVAFARPAQTVVTIDDGYRHRAALDYAADARGAAVYPDGSVATGETVFLRLVDRLSVTYGYRLLADRAENVGGDVELVARLSDGGGWSRDFVLTPARPFGGTAVEATGVLDLDVIRRAIAAFESQAGVDGSSYLLTLRLSVGVHGEADGAPVDDVFQPGVSFRVDDVRLTPETPDGRPASFVQERTEPIEALGPNTIGVRGVELRVAVARAIAAFGVALAALAGLALWGLAGRRRPSGSPAGGLGDGTLA